MIRVSLTSDQRAAVERLRRDPTLKPAERDRVEMVLLSATGWTVPRIARHLGYCAATVRRVFARFQTQGPAGLRHQRPGPAPNLARRQHLEAALTRLLDQDRTWTAAQLAAALRESGFAVGQRQVRRSLRGLRARYGRTARTLKHKQDPDRAAAARAELAAHKRRAAAGQVVLAYWDEVGFSPSQPVNRTWLLPGRRKFIPYENPQGRRLNVIGVLVYDGPTRALWWDGVPRSLAAEDVLLLLRAIPHGDKPLVVVLDNAPIHTSHVIKDAQAELAAEGITVYYLPPYSPELNDIEPYFGVIKHYELPERRYPSVPALQAAIDGAFATVEARLIARSPQPIESRQQLRPAA